MLLNRLTLILLAFVAIALVSPSAQACCPDDGNGSPSAASQGLGQSFPAATDLAPNSTWAVYEFQRDGIRYLQINDAQGVVRAAIGRIGSTAWVMPIGTDTDRTSVTAGTSASGASQVIYRSNELEVTRTTGATGIDTWQVRALDSDL